MLDEQTAAAAVAEWVGTVCEIPEDRWFPYPQASKTAELPDVAASVREARIQRGPDEGDFPVTALTQSWLSIFIVEFSIMVEQGEDEASARAAQEIVYGYAKALREGRLGDASLGGTLDAIEGTFASPFIAFDFTAPFITYEDGTRGRVTPGEIALAQAIPEPE